MSGGLHIEKSPWYDTLCNTNITWDTSHIIEQSCNLDLRDNINMYIYTHFSTVKISNIFEILL